MYILFVFCLLSLGEITSRYGPILNGTNNSIDINSSLKRERVETVNLVLCFTKRIVSLL